MKRHILRRLARFLRPYGIRILVILAVMLAANLLALAAPLLSGWAMDAIGIEAGGVDFAGVFHNCAGMALCYALSALLNYVIAAQLIKVGQAVSHDLRKAAFDHMTELPVGYFDTHPAGDLISRICYDVDTVNATISTDMLQLCTSALPVVGSFFHYAADHLSPTDGRIFRNGAAVRGAGSLSDETDSPPVPPALQRAGKAEWLRRGAHGPAAGHPDLWRGAGGPEAV